MNRLPAPIEYEDITVSRQINFVDSKLALVAMGGLVGLTSFVVAMALGLFH